jgi:hypothetical protein
MNALRKVSVVVALSASAALAAAQAQVPAATSTAPSLWDINAVPYNMPGGEQPLQVLGPKSEAPEGVDPTRFLPPNPPGIADKDLVVLGNELATHRFARSMTLGASGAIDNVGELIELFQAHLLPTADKLEIFDKALHDADPAFYNRCWDRLLKPLLNDGMLRGKTPLTKWSELGEGAATDKPTGIAIGDGWTIQGQPTVRQAAVLILAPSTGPRRITADGAALWFYKLCERDGRSLPPRALQRIAYPPTAAALVQDSRWRTSEGATTYSCFRTTVRGFEKTPFDLEMRESINSGFMCTDYVCPSPPPAMFTILRGRDIGVVIRGRQGRIVGILLVTSLQCDSVPVQSMREALNMMAEGAEARWAAWASTTPTAPQK